MIELLKRSNCRIRLNGRFKTPDDRMMGRSRRGATVRHFSNSRRWLLLQPYHRPYPGRRTNAPVQAPITRSPTDDAAQRCLGNIRRVYAGGVSFELAVIARNLGQRRDLMARPGFADVASPPRHGENICRGAGAWAARMIFSNRQVGTFLSPATLASFVDLVADPVAVPTVMN